MTNSTQITRKSFREICAICVNYFLGNLQDLGLQQCYACDSASFLTGVTFLVAGRAGRDLPNEPLKILPFLVFLSPLPIVFFLLVN
jgi:hypothetical protein